ncbi:MAG: hypothetical protein RR240_06285 [Burkholderiaceae bacterium]
MRRLLPAVLLSFLTVNLPACAVVAVADAAVTVVATAVSVGAKTVGLAADAAIGTAKFAGKVIAPAGDESSATSASSAPATTDPRPGVAAPSRP